MAKPVALQLYSLRNECKEDFEGTLKKVKEMGYDGVEFAGRHGKSAAEVKKLCADNIKMLGYYIFNYYIASGCSCCKHIGSGFNHIGKKG